MRNDRASESVTARESSCSLGVPVAACGRQGDPVAQADESDDHAHRRGQNRGGGTRDAGLLRDHQYAGAEPSGYRVQPLR